MTHLGFLSFSINTSLLQTILTKHTDAIYTYNLSNIQIVHMFLNKNISEFAAIFSNSFIHTSCNINLDLYMCLLKSNMYKYLEYVHIINDLTYK